MIAKVGARVLPDAYSKESSESAPTLTSAQERCLRALDEDSRILAMRYKLSPAQLLRLQTNFFKVDKDGNGMLDADEFCDVLLGHYAIKRQDGLQVFRSWDMDDSKGIELEEWIFVMAKLERGYNKIANKLVKDIVAETDASRESIQWYRSFAVACCLCTACLSWIPLMLRLESLGFALLLTIALRGLAGKPVLEMTKTAEFEQFLLARKVLLDGPNEDDKRARAAIKRRATLSSTPSGQDQEDTN
eukprot:scaffold2631_cov412-Prasinococcus_capsulatus_cf.AAC.9